MYAQVMVDIANANVDRLFTYAVPEDLPIQKGQRVLFPSGREISRPRGLYWGFPRKNT